MEDLTSDRVFDEIQRLGPEEKEKLGRRLRDEDHLLISAIGEKGFWWDFVFQNEGRVIAKLLGILQNSFKGHEANMALCTDLLNRLKPLLQRPSAEERHQVIYDLMKAHEWPLEQAFHFLIAHHPNLMMRRKKGKSIKLGPFKRKHAKWLKATGKW
jgi:hypothetical protein